MTRQTATTLTDIGCLARQQRLARKLLDAQMPGLLVTDHLHIFYFTGIWVPRHFSSLLWMESSGESLLVVPQELEPENLPVNELKTYPACRLGTLVEDQLGSAFQVISRRLPESSEWAIDTPQLHWGNTSNIHDWSSVLLELRRSKDEDEIAMIRHAIAACEKVYQHAATILKPGLREIDLYAEILAVATKSVGEPLGELGNDFQAGSPGGPPRLRPMEAGELLPLDVAVAVRGYRSDLCRTFCVGRQPSEAQLEAAGLIIQFLNRVEPEVKCGVSCEYLYHLAKEELDGVNGWKFIHHLGHGSGLTNHEAPRLNPHWQDVLQEGDFFTLEPGLYHEDLRAGIRIEDDYWLSANGMEKLSHYPRELQ